VDAVWICSPSQYHADQIKACAAAGKHVFCEKPIATGTPTISSIPLSPFSSVPPSLALDSPYLRRPFPLLSFPLSLTPSLPLSLGLAETIEAINTCREANVKLMTALQRRFDPNFARVKRAILEGEVGASGRRGGREGGREGGRGGGTRAL